MVVIAVSGIPGAGSSTAAKILAKKLRLKYFSTGEEFKKLSSKSEGEKKVVSFWKSDEGHSKKLHEQLEAATRCLAEEGDIVIDGKLAVRMLGTLSDFTVWLHASREVRAERYMRRYGTDKKKALDYIDEKTEVERKYWKQIYGFDYIVQENEADISIDTTEKTPEQVAEEIISAMQKRKL